MLRVSDDVTADFRLGDVGGVVDRGPRRRPRVAGRLIHESLLEADLAQRCGPSSEPVRCRRRHIGRAGLGDRRVEVVVGQLDEGLVEPQTQHRGRVSKDLAGPVRAPSQTVGDHGRGGNIDLVGQGSTTVRHRHPVAWPTTVRGPVGVDGR